MTGATSRAGSKRKFPDDFEEGLDEKSEAFVMNERWKLCSAIADYEDYEDSEEDCEDSEEDGDSRYEDDCEGHEDIYPLTVGGPSLPRSLTLELSIRHYEENWTHEIKVTCKRNREIVGRAHGQHINRDRIRTHFYSKMDEVTQDMSDLALEIFDRYGCLKKELKDHPVHKGSGAWGSELDSGSLFLIESISVDPEWKRLGLGTAMIKALMRKAESRAGGIRFSLSFPGFLNNAVNIEARGKSQEEFSATEKRHSVASLAFWRSLGFRRVGASKFFGFTTDPSHAAHVLTPADDYDPQDHNMRWAMIATKSQGKEIQGQVLQH